MASMPPNSADEEDTNMIPSGRQGQFFNLAHNIIIHGGTLYNQSIVGEQGAFPGFAALSRHVSFGATFDSYERHPVGRCHPGTREKIISTIRGWIDDPSPDHSVLWLHGSVGVGKSSIAQTIAELLSKEGKERLAGSFFFARGVIGRNQASALFPTLAYQMAVNIPGMRNLVDNVMSQDYSLPTKTIDIQFNTLIINPLQTLVALASFPSHAPVVVIDGLDECQDSEDQCEILSLIANFCTVPRIPLRFLITSRPEYRIRDAFARKPLVYVTKVVPLQDTEDADRDIEKYLLDKFDEMRYHSRIMAGVERPWPTVKIIEEFVRKASGQFIYASTLSKFVNTKFYDPTERLGILLTPGPSYASAFSELDKAYIHILSQYPSFDQGRTVLGGIIAGLCPRAIQIMLDVKYNHISLVLDALSSLVLVTTGLEDYTVDADRLENVFGPPDSRMTVKFCHASFQDFLLDVNRSGKFSIDVHGINIKIVASYFNIIREALRQGHGHERIPDIQFPVYASVLSSIRLDEVASSLDLRPFLETLERQLVASMAMDPVAFSHPTTLLRYLQITADLLDSLSYSKDNNLTDILDTVQTRLSELIRNIVPHIVSSQYAGIGQSPLVHVETDYLELNMLGEILDLPVSQITEHLIQFQNVICIRYSASGKRSYRLCDIIRRVLRDIMIEGCLTTCWIAAEHALQHAGSKLSSISEVLNRWKIPESEYHIQAGFDEALIKSGIGYLEQIHIFVSAEVEANSPLLSELGRLFSPFSSILFANSSSHRLPVFKNDGSLWEYDELVYFNASKFADNGNSAKTPLTLISYSQTLSTMDSMKGLSEGDSGGEGREEGKNRRIDKGKARDRREKEEDDDEDGEKDDKDIPENPEDQPKENIARPAEIFFEISSDILSILDEETVVQTLTSHGSLSIQTDTTPLLQKPPQDPKRRVIFTGLKFDTEPPTGIAYEQFHVRVIIDSQQQNAFVHDIRPMRTADSDGEERLTTSSKTGRTRGVSAGLTLGPHPQATITGTATKTNEETMGLEKKRYRSAITETHSEGNVRWGFSVDDPNFQKRGIDMTKLDHLPTALFEFVGDCDSAEPAPPPRHMVFVITSYWKITPPEEPRGSWIRKLLSQVKASGNNRTKSYTNLFKIIAFKTDLDPSEGLGRFHYKARVRVRSGASEPPQVTFKRPAAALVDVTSLTVNNLGDPRISDIPTIAKFKLSLDCIPRFDQHSDHDMKSH